jgi:hypothetical protein
MTAGESMLRYSRVVVATDVENMRVAVFKPASHLKRIFVGQTYSAILIKAIPKF